VRVRVRVRVRGEGEGQGEDEGGCARSGPHRAPQRGPDPNLTLTPTPTLTLTLTVLGNEVPDALAVHEGRLHDLAHTGAHLARSVARVSGQGQWPGSVARVSGQGQWPGSVARVRVGVRFGVRVGVRVGVAGLPGFGLGLAHVRKLEGW